MIRQAKVMIYGKDIDIHKILSNNGIVLDGICTEAYATEELSSSGNYYSDYKFTNDGELSELLKEECILKVLLDYGYEIFQINKVTENLKEISVVARQYTIPQQLQLWLHDVRPTNMSGNTALNYMINNAKGDKNIVVSSDITTGYTSYYQLMNFYEACFDCNQSFEKRWGSNGLETKRRGNHIYMNKTIGGDRKLSIIEGKNLKGFKVNRTSNDYITRGIGIGFNGLKGNYIDSPLINNYKDVHTGKFKYDDVKLRTKDMDSNTEGMIFDTLKEVQQELDRRVALEFSVNHVDTILAEYTLDYVKLEDTIEYEDNNYSETEKANIGDYVRVKVPTLNYDLIVRVVEKKYDILTQRTKSIKLSNFDIQSKISTSQVVKNITSAMKSTNNDDMNRYVTAMIEDGLKNSHVIIRPDEILILDTKDINTAKNVWRWNKGALAHTTSGYYSKDWNIGILQTGEIVADQILTGTLSTVTIKPLKESESNMFIDLSTGNLFMDRGKIGSNEFYLDITKQKIVGNNMTIDFPTGRIEAQHGRFGNDETHYDLDTQVIKGNASNLNLKDGVYSFADGNVVINKDNGIKVLKGKIGNETFYIDITNGIIKGNNYYINLKSGSQNIFKAGVLQSIDGKTKLDLNKGGISTSYGGKSATFNSGGFKFSRGAKIEETDHGLQLQGNGTGLYLNDLSNAGNWIELSTNGMKLASSHNIQILSNEYGLNIGNSTYNTNMSVIGNVSVTGDLTCTGRKPVTHITKNFGKIKFYATEDINGLLTITPIDRTYVCDKYNEETGLYSCIIDLNTLDGYLPEGMLRECINVDKEYIVEIYKESFGDYEVVKYNNYFIVKSDKKMKFKYGIKGRRTGFEDDTAEAQVFLYKLKYYYYPLWKKCSEEWCKYGRCIDD